MGARGPGDAQVRHNNMAIVTSFLCWNNTRTGSAVCAYYSLVSRIVSYLLFQFYSDRVFSVSIVVILVQLYSECSWTKGGGSRVLMDPYRYTQTDVNEQQIKF